MEKSSNLFFFTPSDHRIRVDHENRLKGFNLVIGVGGKNAEHTVGQTVNCIGQ